ncbi:hypothetical protein N5O88_05555 [Pseudomonas sp. GD03721]|nr:MULTISPECIES: hypothetical protein [unclassified Pseudomonas]MDH1442071.1 hypothetical protein [Pseudomonas sp. GD03722]WGG02711.1 hypothetical protein N5O88_05555 [Pseudomonas sp. GD03721]WGG06879.1 hypothetical protein N5O87_05565 [Pseudomonas sp. GD03919]
MDYPKSVAGVGLVDGKFVDEDQVNGTLGSLIPAQWGNDVTEEILNVVREVGDVPAEATKNQLVGAIWKMFRAPAAAASETLRGVLRVGTQQEVSAGTADDLAVTPKKLRMGFAVMLSEHGYIAFPSWMGGLIIQWGLCADNTGTVATHTLPIKFPNAFFGVVISQSGTAIAPRPFAAAASNLSQFTYLTTSGASLGSRYIALGR